MFLDEYKNLWEIPPKEKQFAGVCIGKVIKLKLIDTLRREANELSYPHWQSATRCLYLGFEPIATFLII